MVIRNAIVKRPAAPARPTTWQNTVHAQILSNVAGISIKDITHQDIISGFESTGTCVRLMGTIETQNVASEAGALYESLGVGVLVAPIESIAATAVPDPSLTNDQDWYYWWGGELVNDVKGRKWSFDIRSARRLRANYRLLMVFANQTNEVSQTVNVSIRTLWKLG